MWVAPLTFWFSDLHDGTRVDHPSILLELGHRVVQAGRKGSMTIAPWVFENVTVLPTSSLSKQVLAYGRHSHELDEKLVAAQFEQYMRRSWPRCRPSCVRFRAPCATSTSASTARSSGRPLTATPTADARLARDSATALVCSARSSGRRGRSGARRTLWRP